MALGGVVDLVTARGAGCADKVILWLRADGGEEDEFADFLGKVVVLDFVAEAARHSAATRWDGADLMSRHKLQRLDGGSQADQGFLMAVPVETDDTAGFAENGARESAGLVLADEKFLEKKGAWRECESFFAV